MKFCMPHWDELRKAISDRGLDHLVAKDGKAAMAMMMDEIKKQDLDSSNFDPLMAAHNAIAAHAIEQGGLYLLTDDYCPLCELKKHKGNPKEWIDGASNECLELARKMKLVPDVQ